MGNGFLVIKWRPFAEKILPRGFSGYPEKPFGCKI